MNGSLGEIEILESYGAKIQNENNWTDKDILNLQNLWVRKL